MDRVLAAVGVRPDRSRFAAVAGLLLGRVRLWLRGLDFDARTAEQISPRLLTRVDARAARSRGSWGRPISFAPPTSRPRRSSSR